MVARYDERALPENKSKYSIRTRDYLVPPKISAVYLAGYLGQPGDAIFVIARDDFEVKAVEVAIRCDDTTRVEDGRAVRCAGDVFRYNATDAVPAGAKLAIEVTATDWPQNVTRWCSSWVVQTRRRTHPSQVRRQGSGFGGRET